MAGMKNFLKTSILMLLIQSILMGQTFASSRVDDIITLEREAQVRSIEQQLYELQLQKSGLQKIDTHLKRTKKGQNIYLKIETFVGGIVLVGIVIGSYKAYFPPGFRAMLSAYVTATAISRGLIKLSEKEVVQLLKQVTLINVQMMVLEQNLIEQKYFACESLYDHPLCDNL